MKPYQYWSNNSDCEMMEVGRFEDIYFMICYSSHHNQYSFSVATENDLKVWGYKEVADLGYFDESELIKINLKEFNY